MSDRSGPITALVIAILLIAGAIALGVLAVITLPTGAHHGEAVDGLDGFGTLFALVEGAGAFVLLVIGLIVLHFARRSLR